MVAFRNLIKGVAKAMKSKFAHFVDDYPSPSDAATGQRLATACSNDHVEGFHGYIAWLASKLSQQISPSHVVGLAMLGYNAGFTKAVSLTPEDVELAAEAAEDAETLVETHTRCYVTAKTVQKENQPLKGSSAAELREHFEETFPDEAPPTRKERVAALLATHFVAQLLPGIKNDEEG